tara:strand:- start:535 stop:957 length:423 start_codon:yes stop_codon:yes gene_type:complete
MPTTTATIALSSDVTDSALSLSNIATFFKAGSRTNGMDTMTSATKILESTNQVDLFEYTAAGGATHNFLYINNPSTDATEYFIITFGAAGAGSPTDTEEIGRLYGGDWMLIPYGAADANSDVCIAPSVATAMTVEYMLFN